MLKIVHFDLKGAPPKLAYFKQVIQTAKSWGATGCLLEWEDTFPYHHELAVLGSVGGSGGDNMYSQEEVQHILSFIKSLGMTAVQLVQSMGHMEFVLKHPAFRHLREDPANPECLCPSREGSQWLVRQMIRQLLDVQPDVEYLHIGGDEVWLTGACGDCAAAAARSPLGKDHLYLQHMRDLALWIKQQRPQLKILFWDDMIRHMKADALRDYNIGELLTPVVWNYNIAGSLTVGPGVWAAYRAVFAAVWAGSAYKGASGSCQITACPARYVSNHVAWLREIDRAKTEVFFSGFILTGWSRYDHYATLCELLPVAMPSLAACLAALLQYDKDGSIPLDVMSEAAAAAAAAEPAAWPGRELALAVRRVAAARDAAAQLIDSDTVTTYLNPWQLQRGHTLPRHAHAIAGAAQALLTTLLQASQQTETLMGEATGPRAVAEWVGTYAAPRALALARLSDAARAATGPLE